MKTPLVLVLVLVSACSGASSGETPEPWGPDAGPPDAPTRIEPLEVTSLGVQGFMLRYGEEIVLTAPMFTRQSMFDVVLDKPLVVDPAAIASGLAGIPLEKVRTVVSGHAHFDHLVDVPEILALAPGAEVVTNVSGRHMLAAIAPDRPPSCTNAASSQVIARDRVIAMDDPAASHVDYTNCPDQRPPGAPLVGTWQVAPGGRVRTMAFCSMHPAQFGPVHFGEGAVTTDLCDLPETASAWLEGQTLALVIDFLDDAGDPVHRVFYQDAPTNAPIGEVAPAALGTKPVDLALLCVGTYDAVENQPTAILENLAPRYVLSGHWEDFFQPLGGTPRPLPFLDLDTYVQRAEAALAGAPAEPLLIDGIEMPARHVVVTSGMQIVVPAPR